MLDDLSRSLDHAKGNSIGTASHMTYDMLSDGFPTSVEMATAATSPMAPSIVPQRFSMSQANQAMAPLEQAELPSPPGGDAGLGMFPTSAETYARL